MELSVPFETPSTRGPGSRGLVRDTLKELRQSGGEETRALRALSQYSQNELVGGEWRLPWTNTRQKTQLSDTDEARMVSIASALLFSRLVQTAAAEKDYKRANAYIGQAVKALPSDGDSEVKDLSDDTVRALRSCFIGLAHEILVHKLLDTEGSISRANAAVHARIAMYAQDQFAAAISVTPKPVRAWAEDHRTFNMAACRLMASKEQAELGQMGAAIAHLKQAKHPLLNQKVAVELGEAQSANNLVFFQPVPSNPTLPSGRCVVNFTQDYF